MHSETLLSLALIRLANAAAQLPYGSGKTKGELVLLRYLTRLANAAYAASKAQASRNEALI